MARSLGVAVMSGQVQRCAFCSIFKADQHDVQGTPLCEFYGPGILKTSVNKSKNVGVAKLRPQWLAQCLGGRGEYKASYHYKSHDKRLFQLP
jgi:hypothetical protein